MIPAYRIARRLVRKLLKPLRLALIRHQLALSEQNLRYIDDARIEAISLLNAEHRRQVELMARQRAVEGEYA